MRAIERGAEQSCGGGPKSLDNQAAADIVFTSSLCNGVLASVGRLFAGARLGAMNVGGKDESMRNTVRWFLYAIAAGWAGVALAGATPAATRLDNAAPDGADKFAAPVGDAEEQHRRGLMYLNGEGVARDEAAALMWIRRAAEQNLAEAQSTLGFMYLRGLGTERDPAQAAAWFRKAAEGGSASGQVNLGLAYARGDGVARNEAEAVKWLRRAADQGDAPGQYYLGIAYAIGEGVPRSDVEALKWLRMAAEQGDEKARRALQKLTAPPR